LRDPGAGCSTYPYYTGPLNPVSIVAQWLEEHPEPKPLPELHPIFAAIAEIETINEIIDYLKARENND